MKAILEKSSFLDQALPTVDSDRLAITAYGSILSVTSFGNAVNFRVPANVVDSGQVYISSDDWQKVVKKVTDSEGTMVEIEI